MPSYPNLSDDVGITIEAHGLIDECQVRSCGRNIDEHARRILEALIPVADLGVQLHDDANDSWQHCATDSLHVHQRGRWLRSADFCEPSGVTRARRL